MASLNYIEELQNVTHRLHRATTKHVQSVPVIERFQGGIVWDGIVEVFDLTGHPKANRIYAWAHLTDDPKQPKRYVTSCTSPQSYRPKQPSKPPSYRSPKSVIETKKTRKPGRPPLPKGESKGKFLRVRVTPHELREFEKTAKANGKNVSEWSRGILNAAIGV